MKFYPLNTARGEQQLSAMFALAKVVPLLDPAKLAGMTEAEVWGLVGYPPSPPKRVAAKPKTKATPRTRRPARRREAGGGART